MQWAIVWSLVLLSGSHNNVVCCFACVGPLHWRELGRNHSAAGLNFKYFPTQPQDDWKTLTSFQQIMVLWDHFISPFQMLYEAILAGWPLLWSGLLLFFMTQLTPPCLRSRSTTKHWVKCCSFLLITAWTSGMRSTILITHILVPWLENPSKKRQNAFSSVFVTSTWSQK